MGRSTCCAKEGLKKGPWTPEEDQKLVAYIEQHGHGSWSAVPAKAGLKRCGKSCRLRWINYLRPDIKRGKFSLREEQTIIQLHALLGNRWSTIATYLPKRTDNEIKNYWNTHLKKRLTRMGIDPMTHKPKTNMLSSTTGHSKEAANLSHMAQWESARLEAEARLAKESKQSLANINPRKDTTHQLGSTSSAPLTIMNKAGTTPRAKPQCVDILKAWQGVVTGMLCFQGRTDNLESPTSILNFPQKILTNQNVVGSGSNFSRESLKTNQPIDQEEGRVGEKLLDDPIALFNEMTSTYSTDGAWFQDSNFNTSAENILESMSDMFASVSAGGEGNPLIISGENSGEDRGGDSFDQDKNYWNDDSMIDLVNSSTVWSPIF